MLGNILPPYHSMQELNLDWILTKVKNILRFVPDDGTIGQILRRTAHGAEWSDEQGAGGSVTSVNGMQGAVVLTAADVGALPDTYAAPVDSVNGQTGAVVLDADDVGALPDTTVIPTDTGDLTNGAGFVDAAGAAAAAPVQSVNGQTGTVSIVIPSKTSDLNNDSGFVDAAGAAAAAPVQSVNGYTGAVSLTAADVGAAEANTSAAGYCKMPDGTLIQWGSDTISVGANSTANKAVTFNETFYSNPYIAVSTDSSLPAQRSVGFGSVSTTGFRILAQNTSGSSANLIPHWIAIGRWKA